MRLDALDQAAIQFAVNRGAEMVGKKWRGGKLVDNPDAEWVITETTREILRSIVTQAFQDGLGPEELAQLIEDSVAFSPARAEMVARTEIALATMAGALESAKIGGVVAKQWILGSEHGQEQEDECDDNESDGIISLDSQFSSGDDGPPAHPNCVCALVFYTAEDEEAAEFLKE